MMRDTQSYWCEHCPEHDEVPGIPVDEGTGLRSLRELAEHVQSTHPEEFEAPSIEAAVHDVLDEAEQFIQQTITPAIEDAKAQRDESRPLGVDWNDAVDSTVKRYEVKRSVLRERMREERNALNREYFEELAETYADHWASVDASFPRQTTVGLCSARAMAREATDELGYEVDHWMCFWYLQAALPDDHPEHDGEATVVNSRYGE